MDHRPLDLGDVRYRLYRNRRLLLVSALLAATGPALSVFVGGTATFFADPAALLTLVGCWTVLMGFLVVRFPNGWMDPIALSTALIPFTTATPVYEYLFAMVEGDRQTFGAIWIIFLTCFGWFFTYLGVIWTMCNILPRYRLGERRSHSRVKSRHSAEMIFDALVIQPETASQLRTTGPVDEDGFFRVTLHAQMPDAEDFEVGEWSSDYKMKILERDGLRQVTMTAVEGLDGTTSTSVQIETCRPDGDGCIYECEEVHDHFDLLSGIGYWLQDFGSDHYLAEMEMLEDGPKRATRFAPHDSLLTVMARYFKAREIDEEPRL